jgi:hypothetical protein
MANQLRVNWPADRLCNSCFYTAMRTHGICSSCGHDGVLPGRARGADPRPVCMSCAGISGNYRWQPATPKVSCIGTGNALAAHFATTSLD